MKFQQAIAAASVLFWSCAGQQLMKKGDSFALRGNWKEAYVQYDKAAVEIPDDKELPAKLREARPRALEQSRANARRCEEEGEALCVNEEATFILRLEPSDREALQQRQRAREALAAAAMKDAEVAAAQGDFERAISSTLSTRELRSDERGNTMRREFLDRISPAAVSWMRSGLETMVRLSPEDRLPRLRSYESMLAALPSGDADFSTQLIRSTRETEAEVEALRAARQAAERRAQANRSRSVTFVGVLIGPAKADRTPWDGPGAVTRALVAAVTEAATDSAGVKVPGAAHAKAAGLLAQAVEMGARAPDVYGEARLYVSDQVVGVRDSRGMLLSGFPLEVRNQSFAPQWPNRTWSGINLYQARLRVILKDKDLSDDDDIGTVDVDASALLAAAEEGGTHWVPVTSQSMEQVLFVGVSVF